MADLSLIPKPSRLARAWQILRQGSVNLVRHDWSCVLAGMLGIAGFAPFHLFPVLYLSLGWIMWRWLQAPTAATAARQGLAWGLGLFAAGVGWLYVTVHEQALAPAPVALLCAAALVLYLALYPAAVGWLQHRLGGSPARRLLLVIPAGWTLAELLSGWMFSGFPWISFGVSQAPWSPLAGFAPLLGAHGVSWLVLLLSGLLVLAWQQRRAWPLAAVAGLLLSGGALQWVPWTRPIGAPVSVALVQGNIDQGAKWDAAKLSYTLEIHTRLAEQSQARLILLPETAFPIFLDSVNPHYLQRLRQRALANKGDLLLGVPMYTRDRRNYLNSVISLGRSPTQVYSKDHLVPFGEYIPLQWAFGWLYNYMHIPLVDFLPGGSDQPPLQVAGQKLALTICYEDVFGTELREPIPASTMMANVSNDAWFGNTHAPWQHLQMVQMRALESGRWWLRATNNGVTAIVDERGRVVSRLPQFKTAVLEGKAQGRTGTTPYVMWGDAPLWLGSSLLLLLLAWRGRQQTR